MAPSPNRMLSAAFEAAGEELGLPPSLLTAWSYAATGWSVSSYRYEPNFDRLEINGKPGIWRKHPEWVRQGSSCEEFFVFNPDRASEWIDGRDYDFVAQRRIAASYGPCLLRYPSALKHGFTGAPADLGTLGEGVYWAARVLKGEIEAAESLGREGQEAMAFGVMCVGGRVPSRSHVMKVEHAHRELYGQSFFGV